MRPGLANPSVLKDDGKVTMETHDSLETTVKTLDPTLAFSNDRRMTTASLTERCNDLQLQWVSVGATPTDHCHRMRLEAADSSLGSDVGQCRLTFFGSRHPQAHICRKFVQAWPVTAGDQQKQHLHIQNFSQRPGTHMKLFPETRYKSEGSRPFRWKVSCSNQKKHFATY